MTYPENNSTFSMSVSPFKLAAIALLGALILMVISFVSNTLLLIEVSSRFYWIIGGAFTFFYIITSGIFSLSTDNAKKFWQDAMLGYMAAGCLTALLAYLFSGVPIGEAGSFQWIYIVLTFGFVLLLSITNIIGKLVHYAENEKWDKPRPRKRKRK